MSGKYICKFFNQDEYSKQYSLFESYPANGHRNEFGYIVGLGRVFRSDYNHLGGFVFFDKELMEFYTVHDKARHYRGEGFITDYDFFKYEVLRLNKETETGIDGHSFYNSYIEFLLQKQKILTAHSIKMPKYSELQDIEVNRLSLLLSDSNSDFGIF